MIIIRIVSSLRRTPTGRSRSTSPDRIISHQLPLAEARRGYQLFESKEDNCRKVVLRAD